MAHLATALALSCLVIGRAAGAIDVADVVLGGRPVWPVGAGLGHQPAEFAAKELTDEQTKECKEKVPLVTKDEVCPYGKKGGVPLPCNKECAAAEDVLEKCVDVKFDPADLGLQHVYDTGMLDHIEDIVQEDGSRSKQVTFGAVIFLHMLSDRTVFTQLTTIRGALWNCTIGDETEFKVRNLMRRNHPMGCSLSVEALRVAAMTICHPNVNRKACSKACSEVIEIVGENCRPGGHADHPPFDHFFDRENTMRNMSDTSVVNFFTKITPDACVADMLKGVFLKDPPPDFESEAYATDQFFRMFTSFGFLGMLLCIGKLLRVKVSAFRKINMPVCLMSGMLGLIFKESVGLVSPNKCAWLKHFFMAGWGDLAYLCYVVIFGTMFIGAEVPSPKEIWMTGAPQMAFGMACQHGVWISALMTTQLLVAAGFKIPGYFGAAVPLGFVGSHGAATQFEATFTEMSWDAGFNLVLMNATFGLMGGLLAGTVVVNIILKLGLIKREADDEAEKPEGTTEDDGWVEVGLIPKEKQEPIGYRTTAAESMESVVLHLGLIGVMLMIGYSIKQILTAIENTSTILQAIGLLSAIPFFTCCMLTGLAINTLLIKLDLAFMIDKETIDTIGTICLEVLISAAIPTTDLTGGLDAVAPFFACCCSVFIFMLVMLFVVAPFMFPNYPYQRGLFEFGQSTASTPMGFMLIKMADPKCPPIVYKSIGCYVLMDGPNYGIWMAVVAVTFPTESAGTKLLAFSGTYWTLWLVLYFVLIRRTFGSPEVMGTSESPKEDSFAPMASGAGTAVSAKRMSSHGLTQSEDSAQRRGSTRQRTSSSQIIEMSSRPSLSGDGS